MADINDMIDMTKPPMLTDSERAGITTVANMLATPLDSPVRTIVLSDEMTLPFSMVLKAGLEALK